MIISHKHKFIFIKTRKTAGTSIELALSSICGPNDILTSLYEEDENVRKKLGLRSKQNVAIPFSKYTRIDWLKFMLKLKRRFFYTHMPAEEIKQYVGDDVWNSYYKFCFERNPYDKVISFYHWHKKKKPGDSILNFLKSGEMKIIRGVELYTIDRIVVVDDIYSFEDLQGGLNQISENLKLEKPITLPKYKAKSKYRTDKRHYSEILSKDERELIEFMFAREFNLLDYKF